MAPAHGRHPLRLAIAMHCSLSRATTDFYSAGIMRGIQIGLAEKRFEATVSFIETWSAEELAQMMGKSVSGVLLVAPHESRLSEIESLAKLPMPTVVVGSSWPTSHVPTVDSDNFQGMEAALASLLQMGHTKIACIYAWPELSNHRDRLRAFRLFMARQQLVVKGDWIAEATPDEEYGKPLHCPSLRTLLGAANRPTAIMATDYQIVPLLVHAAEAADLNIPDDLSIITFDDPFPMMNVKWPLTTVDQPLTEMGKTAVGNLIALCKNPMAGSDSMLQMTLNMRQSCAPPREK